MKKRILCCIFAVILLVMAVPAFAEARSITQAGYSAGKTTPVRHFFTTSNYVTKSSSETWLQVQDRVNASGSYSYFCDKDGKNATEGYHYTYLVDDAGNLISSDYIEITHGSSGSFSKGDMDRNSSANKIKLRIYNPKYNNGNPTAYMQTKGTINGASN